LAAENLFLRKQLALFRERDKKAAATSAGDRFVFSKLAGFFDWRSALVIVKPATLIGCHRAAFRRFWHWKSRPVGRPPVEAKIRRLIWRIAAENPTWGEERIADELLKLQIRVSPRMVGKYIKRRATSASRRQRSALVHFHTKSGTCLCRLRLLCCGYGTLPYPLSIRCPRNRIQTSVHLNVTEHPTADWTLQQLREALPGDGHRKFLLHDRHSTLSANLDEQVGSWGIRVLRSPVRMPTANAHCERLIGSIRRECVDYVIPFHALYLRRLLREWVRHYDTGRPHRSLGPGIPEQTHHRADPHKRADEPCRASRVIAKPILGGFHHEYRWENAAA
jgi:putative transposase